MPPKKDKQTLQVPGAGEKTKRPRPEDCALAIESSAFSGAHKPGFIELNQEVKKHHPADSFKETLIWVRAYSPGGREYPTTGKQARNYPIILPAAYAPELAKVVSRYLHSGHPMTEASWDLIHSQQLPAKYRDIPTWVFPEDGTLEDEVYRHSPHLYIWMMANRYVPDVLPDYKTPWDNLLSLRNLPRRIQVANAMVPPFDLVCNRAELLEDRDNFHGNRGWRATLCRTDEYYPRPSLCEIVRTHPPSNFHEKYANVPLFYLLYYLIGCRQQPGYYKNNLLCDLTKDGMWDKNKCPFSTLRLTVHDGDDSEYEFEGDEKTGWSGHWYSPAELYWILVDHYGLDAELMWEFVSYASKLPLSTPKRIDLETCLQLFDYVDEFDAEEDQSIAMHNFGLDKNPLPTTSQGIPRYPGVLHNSATATAEITVAMLDEWRLHCDTEYATSQLRQMLPASGVTPRSSQSIQKGSKLGPTPSLPLVEVKYKQHFDPAYFGENRPLPITDFSTRPSKFYASGKDVDRTPSLPDFQPTLRLVGEDSRPSTKDLPNNNEESQDVESIRAAQKLKSAQISTEDPAAVLSLDNAQVTSSRQPTIPSTGRPDELCTLEQSSNSTSPVDIQPGGAASSVQSVKSMAAIDQSSSRDEASGVAQPIEAKSARTERSQPKIPIKNVDSGSQAGAAKPASSSDDVKSRQKSQDAVTPLERSSGQLQSTAKSVKGRLLEGSTSILSPAQGGEEEETGGLLSDEADVESDTMSKRGRKKKGRKGGHNYKRPRRGGVQNQDSAQPEDAGTASKTLTPAKRSRESQSVDEGTPRKHAKISGTKNNSVSLKDSKAIIKEARDNLSGRVAAGTPVGPHPYSSWDASDDIEPTITYGSDNQPDLSGGLLYDCFCELDLTGDKVRDPPAYVHLSDKEVGRLYTLVHKGYRTIEYITHMWSHVFNTKGAVFQHRLPQGEPALAWNSERGRLEYVVVHGNRVLMGGGAWNSWADKHTHPFLIPQDKVESTDKNNKKSMISWSTTAYIEAATLVHPNRPQLSGWVPDRKLYLYDPHHHDFAIVVDPFRIQSSLVTLIHREAANPMAPLGLIDLSRTLQRLYADNAGDLPEPDLVATNVTLATMETTREHWWASHHTVHNRYIEMAKQNIAPATAVDNSEPRISALQVARTNLTSASGVIAQSMKNSAVYYGLYEMHKNAADASLFRSLASADFVEEQKQSYSLSLDAVRADLADPESHDSLDVQVHQYSLGRFDDQPEMKARWLAAIDGRISDDFMPDYHTHHDGEMSLVPSGLAEYYAPVDTDMADSSLVSEHVESDEDGTAERTIHIDLTNAMTSESSE